MAEEQPVEAQPPAEPPARRRRRWSRLIGPLTTGLLCLGLITLLVAQLVQANELLQTELGAKDARIAADESQVSALKAQIQDLKERWFGTPDLYQAPAIANTAAARNSPARNCAGTLIRHLRNLQRMKGLKEAFSLVRPEPGIL